MSRPRTRYARTGDLSIAYQVVGDGPFDLVLVPGGISHLDLGWEDPAYARFLRRLASFSRLILFDKRGIGLSDPVPSHPTLEERMDDIRVVMDAAGSERAALFGYSEGGPTAAMFAASYPERANALALYGTIGVAPGDSDSGYVTAGPAPEWWAAWPEVLDRWGEGLSLRLFAPDLKATPTVQEHWGTFERAAASPGMMRGFIETASKLRIGDFLPAIQTPTLVIHRTRDFLPVAGARLMAKLIPGARFVELPGADHIPSLGDADTVVDLVEEFLTGAPPATETDRVLATVLFTDIVRSTERASEVGDRRWRELLEAHDGAMRDVIGQYRGREVKQTGDGFLATFDGPGRAIRCAGAAIDEVERVGLGLRAGLHTGECELRGDDVGGIAVHIAARVAALAQPGEVLVSSTVKDLVYGSGIEFSERGSQMLKGVPGEWHLYAAANGFGRGGGDRYASTS